MDPFDCPGEQTFRRRLAWGALMTWVLAFGWLAHLGQGEVDQP